MATRTSFDSKFSEHDRLRIRGLSTYSSKNGRPMSWCEIQVDQTFFQKNMPLGQVVEHPNCGHHYRVKTGSKKERALQEDSNFTGRCSVCWTINHNNRTNKDNSVVADYMEYQREDPSNIPSTQREYYTWKSFYQWLHGSHRYNNRNSFRTNTR